MTTASSVTDALIGGALCSLGLIVIYAATLRPKLFANKWIRPRWTSDQGTPTGRVAGAASGCILFSIGIWLVDNWVDILPISALVYLVLGSFGFLLVAAVGEYVYSFKRAPGRSNQHAHSISDYKNAPNGRQSERTRKKKPNRHRK